MNNNLKFNDKYRIPSARLKGYDYGQNGAYFITICTKDRIHYFGDIPPVETQYLASDLTNKTQGIASLRTNRSVIGEIAQQYWSDIPKYFPFVELDGFVVMPNHIHGIIIINKDELKNGTVETQYLASGLTDKTQDIADDKMQDIADDKTQDIADDKTQSIAGNKTQSIAGNKTQSIAGNKAQGIASLRGNKFGPQSNNLASIIRGFKSGVKSYATRNKIEFLWQERFYDRIIRDADEIERIREYIYENPLK
jgi:putative transposase